LQRQTFGNFEAIISVDGNDAATAAACRPFLADPRFRIVVHPERLDWVGNFNWLLQQDLREFFCYRQHDDTTAPDFFEVLLRAADEEPNAAAVYCDCQYSGGSNHIEFAPSIEGEPLHRMIKHIESKLSAAPVRGLIRRAAIRQAGLVRTDELRAPLEVFVWLAKILRWGNFRRVAEPLYYRLDRPRSFTNEFANSPTDRKRAVWTTLFTGLLEAVMPLCQTPEERLFFQQTICDRILAYPAWNEPKKLMAECLERLRYEENTHLLGDEELSEVLQGLLRVQRSQMQWVIYRIRRQSRMARIIYPRSKILRVIYRIRQLLQRIAQKTKRLLLPI
jgi:glycosyltransferase involved in cell wall biosynthesis